MDGLLMDSKRGKEGAKKKAKKKAKKSSSKRRTESALSPSWEEKSSVVVLAFIPHTTVGSASYDGVIANNYDNHMTTKSQGGTRGKR